MGLEEHELRVWVHRVAHGEASRRHFLHTMLGLGLSGPMIADLLAASTPAAAQGTREAPQAFTPTRRGGGGKLRLLFWEAPEMLNKHAPGATLDPQRFPTGQFVSWEIAQKANNWMGLNKVRWANVEYDQLWQQARTELDPVKRAALFIRMNDLVIEDVVVIPTVWRHDVSAVSHSLRGLELGPWDAHLWNLAYWYRET